MIGPARPVSEKALVLRQGKVTIEGVNSVGRRAELSRSCVFGCVFGQAEERAESRQPWGGT